MSNIEIPIVEIDQLSYSAVPIYLINKQIDTELYTQLASATAFFVRYEGIIYLVTNWHVVTGMDPVSKLTKTTRPSILRFPAFVHKNPYMKWEYKEIELYNDENMDIPKWLVHPTHKAQIDVILIEVDVKLKIDPIFINEYKFDKNKPNVADDVYVLGFPYSRSGGGLFPIWKRGSIASEPDFNLDGLPKMLIDTASRDGMSGAPVIFRRTGIHGFINGKPTADASFGMIQNFIGIYSGRIKDSSDRENLIAQLGIVWKGSVIKEIAEGKCYDTIDSLQN